MAPFVFLRDADAGRPIGIGMLGELASAFWKEPEEHKGWVWSDGWGWIVGATRPRSSPLARKAKVVADRWLKKRAGRPSSFRTQTTFVRAEAAWIRWLRAAGDIFPPLERRAKVVAVRRLKRRAGRPSGYQSSPPPVRAEAAWVGWLRAAINMVCPDIHVCQGGTVCRVHG
jgi:hypothetical protein